eukprot:s816_g17.t1
MDDSKHSHEVEADANADQRADAHDDEGGDLEMIPPSQPRGRRKGVGRGRGRGRGRSGRGKGKGEVKAEVEVIPIDLESPKAAAAEEMEPSRSKKSKHPRVQGEEECPAESESKPKVQKISKERAKSQKKKKTEDSKDEQTDSKVAATPPGDGADAVTPETPKSEQTAKTKKKDQAKVKPEAKTKPTAKSAAKSAAKAKAKAQSKKTEAKHGAEDQKDEQPATFAGRYCAQTEPARSKWLAIRDVKFWNYIVADASIKQAKTYDDFWKAANALEDFVFLVLFAYWFDFGELSQENLELDLLELFSGVSRVARLARRCGMKSRFVWVYCYEDGLQSDLLDVEIQLSYAEADIGCARPVTALPSVVAELPWSTWEETDLEDCLFYLMGSDRLKIPEEWVAHVLQSELEQVASSAATEKDSDGGELSPPPMTESYYEKYIQDACSIGPQPRRLEMTPAMIPDVERKGQAGELDGPETYEPSEGDASEEYEASIAPSTPQATIPYVNDTRAKKPTAGELHLSRAAIASRMRRETFIQEVEVIKQEMEETEVVIEGEYVDRATMLDLWGWRDLYEKKSLFWAEKTEEELCHHEPQGDLEGAGSPGIPRAFFYECSSATTCHASQSKGRVSRQLYPKIEKEAPTRRANRAKGKAKAKAKAKARVAKEEPSEDDRPGKRARR